MAVSWAAGPVAGLSTEISVSAPQSAPIAASEEPPVAAAARELLAASARSWPPREIRSQGESFSVERLAPGSERAIVCAGSGGGCALVRAGQERFLVNTEPGARATLREAASAGEPAAGGAEG